MFKVHRKSIEQVKSFFGCSSWDAIYYLMPDDLIDEMRLSDVTIIDTPPGSPAADADRGAGYANTVIIDC